MLAHLSPFPLGGSEVTNLTALPMGLGQDLSLASQTLEQSPIRATFEESALVLATQDSSLPGDRLSPGVALVKVPFLSINTCDSQLVNPESKK